MSEGLKSDGDKMQPVLVLETMARALQAVCEVGTFGAKKYSADNWLQVADGLSRYKNAKHRHMLAAAMGEKHDPESGLPHAAHEAWNALAALELELRAGETEKNKDLWGEGEKRMDDIGRNGNEGEHYDYLVVPERMVVPEEVKFIRVHESGFATGYNQHLTADASLSVLAAAHELGEVGREQQGDYIFYCEHWLRV